MGGDDRDPPPRLPSSALFPLEAEPRRPSLIGDLDAPQALPRPPYVPPLMGQPPPRGARMLEPASALCQSALAGLVRALRGLHVYVDNEDQRTAYFESVAEKFEALLGAVDRVEFRIAPDRICLRNDVVHYHPDERRGLPGLLYRGGLRLLTINHGLDRAELARLLDALATDFSRPEHRHSTLVEVLGRQGLIHLEAQGAAAVAAPPLVPPREPARPSEEPRVPTMPASSIPIGQRRTGLQVVPARVAREAVARLSAAEPTADAPPPGLRPRAPSFAALALPVRPSSSGAHPDLVRVINSIEQVVDDLYALDDEETTDVGAAGSVQLLAELRDLVARGEDPSVHLPARRRRSRSSRGSGRRSSSRSRNGDEDEPTQVGTPGQPREPD